MNQQTKNQEKPLSLLIIDDEQDLCMLLNALLKRLGHRSEYALNLKSGLDKFLAVDPDVVFLDLNLTDGSGFSLLPRLIAHKPSLHVIIISAYNGQEEMEEAKAKGAYSFLEKPFRIDQIRKVIAEINEKT